MPCPHNEITIVQRSQRQSAVAAAAYQSGEKLFCEYDQQVKHYPEKRGIVHNEILLPPNAPQEYADRNTLSNKRIAEGNRHWFAGGDFFMPKREVQPWKKKKSATSTPSPPTTPIPASCWGAWWSPGTRWRPGSCCFWWERRSCCGSPRPAPSGWWS